ncbi:MAG TPA: hypothetical protein VFB72_11505 [Verrucomicrobiae bacterium]|nr:hypothetical protein [Verrucomicrobiae bacterium]
MNKIARHLKAAQMAQTGSFRDAPARPGLYLLELRSHHADALPLHRRRLIIPVRFAAESLPKIIKITHVG